MEQRIYPNRMLILFNVVLMAFMATLDGSIVNVALPVIAERLRVTTGEVSWVVTAYLIVIATTILIFGKLGDLYGKIKVFKIGIAVFTLGSLLCGISETFFYLVAARVVQGIGAAGAMATNQGIITQVFPKNERGKALGIAGTSVALGSLVGPPLGGFIVNTLNWEYIFLINLPIGLFALFMGARVLPADNSNTTAGKLDVQGSLLIVTTILALFGSLILGEDIGYTEPGIIAGFIIAVLSLIVFLITEKKVAAPLLELQIFENKMFSLSILCAFISFLAISSSTIIQPFYLQNVMWESPAMTGIIMMAFPLVLAIVAPISGSLSDKIGSELLTFLGLIFTSTGLLLMSTLHENSDLRLLVVYIVVMSIGNGMFQSPNTSLIMSTVSFDKLGIAGSINGLVRNLGMISGVALATTLLYNRISYQIGYHTTTYIPGQEKAFIYGMRFVYITAAVICALGALLTAYRLYRKDSRKQ